MKELVIVRHAKSSWENAELNDIERPLNKRGYRDAHKMKSYLSGKNINIDAIITSPAVRAFSTALILSQGIILKQKNIIVDKNFYKSIFEVKKAIKLFDNALKSVMIVGHNPTFTDLVYKFVKTDIEKMPTCCVFSIKFLVDNWSEISKKNSILNFIQVPKQIK